MPLICCLDLETTSNKIESARIVELGFVVYDLNPWVQRTSYARRFNPGVHIHEKALAVHGIADADVMGCPGFEQVAGTLARLFDRIDVFVGHNIIDFDLPILMGELARAGCTLSRSPEVIDTMQEARWATPDGKQPSLGELCWSLNVHYDTTKAHGALYDVEVNIQAFKRGFDLGYFTIPKSVISGSQKDIIA